MILYKIGNRNYRLSWTIIERRIIYVFFFIISRSELVVMTVTSELTSRTGFRIKKTPEYSGALKNVFSIWEQCWPVSAESLQCWATNRIISGGRCKSQARASFKMKWVWWDPCDSIMRWVWKKWFFLFSCKHKLKCEGREMRNNGAKSVKPFRNYL